MLLFLNRTCRCFAGSCGRLTCFSCGRSCRHCAAASMTGVAGVFNIGLSTYISCPGDKACTAISTFDNTGIAVKRIALVVSRIDDRALLH